LKAILEIAGILHSSLSSERLPTEALSRISSLMEAERTTLFLIDEEHREIWAQVPRNGVSFEIRLPVGHGIAGYVAQTGEVVNVADAYSDPRFHPSVDRSTGYLTRALLSVPVKGRDGSVVGVLQSLNKSGGFTAEDVETLSGIAELVGLNLENVQLYSDVRRQNVSLQQAQERLRQKVAQVDLLLAIEREVSSASSLEAMLTGVLGQAKKTFDARAMAVLLTDGHTSELFVLNHGGTAVETRVVPAPDSSKALRKVLSTGEPAFTRAFEVERGTLAELAGHEWKSALCTPLADSDVAGHPRVAGSIEWIDPGISELTPDLRALAGVVAEQISHALKFCRARLETERTNRLAALGQMLGGLVHDMRSPMTVIGGYAELLSRENDSLVRDRYSQHIQSQLDYVNTMARDVLAFIRGERQLLARRVPLTSFWQEMLPVLSRELTPAGVELKLKLDYTGAARLDEGKLKRAITNLARNAAQAMTAGGEFRVSCAAEGDTLVLIFADNGPGLPPQIANRLFTAFTSHGKKGGTGLGLALVKEIVEAHGGQVSCMSSPGEGTSFELRFPHALLS
jgi:signal transduction histidine kinase